jgi:hypothetical protein
MIPFSTRTRKGVFLLKGEDLTPFATLSGEPSAIFVNHLIVGASTVNLPKRYKFAAM